MDHELILTDETGVQITVKVSAEDYVRAMTDITFAQQLLISASSSSSSPSHSSELCGSEVGCGDEENEDSHEQQTTHKHEWQHDEVKCLLHSFEQHKDELSHPKKRKFAWDNIANDVVSNGYTVNATICKNKWKNLLRTYKTAKDSKKRTGNAPSRFNFFNDIDDIIGKKPSNSCTHTLESGGATNVMQQPSKRKCKLQKKD
ncbi:unnamed protein product [Tenebrio molitor]|nr:unnamed protein product [Tenebrio molitor]